TTTEGPVTEFVRDRARPNAAAAAASFALDGTPVGAIAILSDPANLGPKPPWYIINAPSPQDFRFLDAAVLAPAIKTLPPNGTWDLRYRVALRKAPWTPEDLRAVMSDWLGTRSATR